MFVKELTLSLLILSSDCVCKTTPVVDKYKNSAPPAKLYQKGDPWYNPTAKETELFLKDLGQDSSDIGFGG